MLKASSIDIIVVRILTFNPKELFLGDEISTGIQLNEN